jgi:histone H3/H4
MYEGMAAGTPFEELRKSELTDFLDNFSLRGQEPTAGETAEALATLLKGIATDAEIGAAVNGSGRETFDMDDITDVMDEMDFDRLAVSYWRIDQFLIAVGLEDEIFGVPEFYPPPGDPTPEGMFSRGVYNRGALTLHALRLAVGNETFFDILRTYANRFMHSNASTADFIAVAEEVSGQELDDFFDAWLYENEIADMPELDLFREDYLLPDSQ